MEEVYKFLKDCVVFYVATVNDGLPEVRPFGAVDIFEGRMYLQTGNVKKVFKQMMAKPRIAISAASEDGMS
ncbi:MAG: pyridoxamine 5'-phosphate oxidase family protein [Synergistaceae bacterium]|nr:pyridoxamine 5'-phosphate oxidase family protein [Synergistaceae bacterium]